MDLILDTCGLLSLSGIAVRQLTPDCLSLLKNADRVCLSACSLYEIALKHRRGKLSLGRFTSAQAYWDCCIEHYDLEPEAVSAEDFASAVDLPEHHADPFDRIIIAQAMRLSCPIVSYDNQFKHYGLEIIQ